jgi:hypothetical protein
VIAPDKVLEMSYANLIMYSSVLPSYDDEKEGDKNDEEIINADDPRNQERIRRELFG